MNTQPTTGNDQAFVQDAARIAMLAGDLPSYATIVKNFGHTPQDNETKILIDTLLGRGHLDSARAAAKLSGRDFTDAETAKQNDFLAEHGQGNPEPFDMETNGSLRTLERELVETCCLKYCRPDVAEEMGLRPTDEDVETSLYVAIRTGMLPEAVMIANSLSQRLTPEDLNECMVESRDRRERAQKAKA